jgi:hypothetical protein
LATYKRYGDVLKEHKAKEKSIIIGVLIFVILLLSATYFFIRKERDELHKYGVFTVGVLIEAGSSGNKIGEDEVSFYRAEFFVGGKNYTTRKMGFDVEIINRTGEHVRVICSSINPENSEIIPDE